MNLAAIDLGSNSFHMLVARVSSSFELTKLASHKEVLKLGTIVQAEGRLPPPVFQTALDAVAKMQSIARACRVERTLVVATSALREAANGEEFCRAVHARLGLTVELLSGAEEAELAYRGARSAFGSIRGRVAVVDLGGGSAEIAVGEGSSPRLVASLPLGFLRLAQRLGDVKGSARSELIQRWVYDESAEVREQLQSLAPDAWVFSGGTARAFGKLVLGGGSGLAAATVRRVAREIGRARPEELAALGVDSTRIETLGTGAEILSTLVSAFGIHSLRISPRGIREGLLVSERERADRASGEFPAAFRELAS